jgi:hypothetical protein
MIKYFLSIFLSIFFAVSALCQSDHRIRTGAWVGTSDLIELLEARDPNRARLGQRDFTEELRRIDRLNLSQHDRNARVNALMTEMNQTPPSGPKPALSLDVGTPFEGSGPAAMLRFSIELGGTRRRGN